MTTQEYYDQYWTTDGYNPRRDRTPTFLQQLYERYVDTGDDCLDVGCGDGDTSGTYLSRHARSYLGVDISENAVAVANDRGFKVRQIADASVLPFRDRSFDVVVCIEVLEHCFEPHRASAEALRVLRPGGRYIVTVPNAAYWRDRLDALCGVWQPGGDDLGRAEPWRSPHVRFFRPATLKRMLIQTGFDCVRVVGVPVPLGSRVPLVGRPARNSGVGARVGARWMPSLLAGGVAAIAFVDSRVKSGKASPMSEQRRNVLRLAAKHIRER